MQYIRHLQIPIVQFVVTCQNNHANKFAIDLNNRQQIAFNNIYISIIINYAINILYYKIYYL